MTLPPFQMERWQSTYEHRVEHNLSESGVEPYTVDGLLELIGEGPGGLAEAALGYTQTNGTAVLRERIAALYPEATADNVLVTTGGAEANFLVLWGLLEPGDEAAILVPTYGQTPGLAAGLGAKVRTFALEESRGWQPAPGAAGEAIGPDTRLVVVTNPNNPTGAVLSGRAREEIHRACDRTGAWLLADEVYAGAEHGAEPGGPATPTFRGSGERVLITGSLSKAYGLPGLRLGWLVGPSEEIGRLWARKDYTTIAPAALSDRLAAAVLEPAVRGRVLERTRRIIGENLRVVTEWLDARPDRFAYRPPDAGAICFLRYHSDVNSSELAERLRREKDVLVVPGNHFGMDRHLRIGFGGAAPGLREALDRTGELFDDIET